MPHVLGSNTAAMQAMMPHLQGPHAPTIMSIPQPSTPPCTPGTLAAAMQAVALQAPLPIQPLFFPLRPTPHHSCPHHLVDDHPGMYPLGLAAGVFILMRVQLLCLTGRLVCPEISSLVSLACTPACAHTASTAPHPHMCTAGLCSTTGHARCALQVHGKL